MTHPIAVENLRDDKAVEELEGVEIAGPLLAAIQHSYEEAKACIDDRARFSWPSTPDGTEPLPGTEKIDLRLVKPPAVRAATTPPTAAMSLAARLVAEQPVSEGVGSSTAASGPNAERHRASARQEPVAQVGHDSPDLASAPRLGRRLAVAFSRWLPASAANTPTATPCDV